MFRDGLTFIVCLTRGYLAPRLVFGKNPEEVRCVMCQADKVVYFVQAIQASGNLHEVGVFSNIGVMTHIYELNFFLLQYLGSTASKLTNSDPFLQLRYRINKITLSKFFLTHPLIIYICLPHPNPLTDQIIGWRAYSILHVYWHNNISVKNIVFWQASLLFSRQVSVHSIVFHLLVSEVSYG